MQVQAVAAMFSRLHGGEPGAWAALVSELAPQVIGYLERLGVDHHQAEDLTQEVLGTVYRKLAELRDPMRFFGWVKMIARNRMRSRLRRTRFTEILDEETPIERPDALIGLQGDELRRVVSEELGRFRAPVRRMLELKLLEDRSPTEVAEILGMPRELFRRRFHLALKALRVRMARRIDAGDFAMARASRLD